MGEDEGGQAEVVGEPRASGPSLDQILAGQIGCPDRIAQVGLASTTTADGTAIDLTGELTSLSV